MPSCLKLTIPWVLWLLPALAAAGDQGPNATPPNIVVLLADDLGYGELGCQGNPQIPTPAIDSIAADGVRCTCAYVTAPNCSPSRAGMLTGRIPTRFGYEFNPIGAGNEDPLTGLPAAEITLAEALHDVGYATGLLGKWHQGGAARYHPLRHGFDEFFGFLHEGHYYAPPPYHGLTTMLRRRSLPLGKQGRWRHERLIYSTHMGHDEPPYDANNPILRGGQPVEEAEYLTDALTREATDFIQRRRDQPFFLLVAYNAVHSPLQGANRWVERFEHIDDIQRRIFAAMLANLDESVGAILAELAQHDLERNTLVFFLSDNGGPTRELTSSNRPLRGEKGSMYEGGLRVPFLAKWPGQLPAGRVCASPLSAMDIYATVVRLADAAAPENLDGVDVLPTLQEAGSPPAAAGEAPHEWFYWRQGKRAALRRGPWKIVAQTRRRQRRVWELYHLPSDLAEEHNLAESEPVVLQELVELWREKDSEMAAPLFR